jgi:hypothetical protein
VSGSPTLLADVVVPGGIAVNTPYTLRVVASGPTITVYKDSIVPLTTFTSSLGQTATKHGLHIFDTTSSVDELSIVAAATSGGGDTTPPTLLSITRNSGSPTNATSVSWTVVFSEPVNGVTASNFGLVNGGLIAPSITSAVGPGPTDTWVVTANTGSGNGTLGLNLANNTGITDVASNALTTASFTGQVYTIDKTVIPPPPSSDTIATNLKTQKNLLAALHIGI